MSTCLIAVGMWICLFPRHVNADDYHNKKIQDIEKQIRNYTPDPRYKDDAYGLVVVKDALTSLKEGSGGIGACLGNEKNGKVVARGRNRQYTPYFRSGLHGELIC